MITPDDLADVCRIAALRERHGLLTAYWLRENIAAMCAMSVPNFNRDGFLRKAKGDDSNAPTTPFPT